MALFRQLLWQHTIKRCPAGQGLKSSITTWTRLPLTKLCGQCMLARRPLLLPHRKKDLIKHGKRGIACCLVPPGVYFLTNWLNSGCSCDLAKIFLVGIKVQCEGEVVTKQLKQHQTTWKGWIVKMIQRFYSNFLLCAQCVKVSAMFGPLLVLYPLTLLSTTFYSTWLKALFHVVQCCGPIYIKLGQWASTRRDLFSAEFCELFSQLHAHVQPHAWCHTEHTLLTAYGKRWHEVIKIDKTQQPLGSGCVAQVYKGYIHTSNLPPETVEAMEDNDSLDDIYFRDGVEIHSLSESFSFSEDDDGNSLSANTDVDFGTPYADDPDYIAVAIKVLHPGVNQQFSRDLTLMKAMARFLETVIPSLRWVNLIDCVHEFSLSMIKQMDMIHEARCLKRFHADFADMPSIRIPVPVMSLVRRNILVESFEEGQPISDFITDKEEVTPGLREKMADLGVDALLQMVFVKNFVHGDLHPGNILVQNAGAFTEQTEDSLVMVDMGDVVIATVAPKECPVRLVLLDCGITASLGKEDRVKFNQVFTAVVKGQGEVVADLFLEKSHHVECTDPDAFRRDMADLVNRARETTLQLSKIKVAALLSEVFSVLSQHKVKLESNFATMILAIGILEGLGRSLDPHLDILSKASTLLLSETFRV